MKVLFAMRSIGSRCSIPEISGTGKRAGPVKNMRLLLVDCMSMHVMRRRDLTDVLTHDAHFAQEGFNTLL